MPFGLVRLEPCPARIAVAPTAPRTALTLEADPSRRKGGMCQELVTAISGVPPGAFNPTEGIEQVPLSCWCTWSSGEEEESVSFWENFILERLRAALR